MKQIKCKDTGEKFRAYKDYLESKHWKEFRKNFPKERKCISCGSTVNLHLHHHTYAHIGNEQVNELDWLCETCHRLIHEMKPKKEKTPKHVKEKKKTKRRVKRSKQICKKKNFGLQEKKAIDNASVESLRHDVTKLSNKTKLTEFENKVLEYSTIVLNKKT